jgi:polyferredoxin
MTTETKLFAAQEPIFPRKVSGWFRRLKWAIMIATLGVYYLTPWIRWDRGPNLPDQAVLVDLAGRRFYFFWIEIWPHEFWLVAGLLIMAGLGLFLFTSALGRVWCGYACPQTVWTDLFYAVERRIEGDRNTRVKLWNEPWTARKIRLRVTKWAAWLLIAVATGGAWVFYFADAPTLAVDLVTLQAPFVAYATIAILTFTTFLLGGFAREQVCLYMCPWPRIQGAMMDPGTLTVGYRHWRGEPRGKGTKRREEAAAEAIGGGHATARYALPEKDTAADRTSRSGEHLGDCVDCNACVAVCPMGIDIREGQQMACITCALCIDACDEVMAKIGRPRGLIDYLALDDEPPLRPEDRVAARPMGSGVPDEATASVTTPVAGAPRLDVPHLGPAPAITASPKTEWRPVPIWKHIFRPRTLVYFAAWAAIGVGLVTFLFVRPDIDMTVAPIRNPTYVTLSDGTIRNSYDVRLRNKHGDDRPFHLSITAPDTLRIALEGTETLTTLVPANQTKLQRVYVSARPQDPAAQRERTEIRFWVEDIANGERAFVDSHFFGRESYDERQSVGP